MSDTSILRHYLAPLQPWLSLSDALEVVINRPGEVGVETLEGWRWFAAPVLTEAWLSTLARAAAAHTAQDVGEAYPICSTVLPEGERCQIVLPPAAERPSITIRKPSRIDLDLAGLASQGLFEKLACVSGEDEVDTRLSRLKAAADWPEFFTLAVAERRNILISGATGSGKTTFAKALVRLIPEHERIITIEDVRELWTPHVNAVHLLYAKDGQGRARVGPKDLLESALRMRPDRVLLQELRDGAAYLFLRAVNTGHPGSITTIHADSASLALEQLTLLVKESEAGRSLRRAEVQALLRRLIDVIVQLRRDGEGFRITEVWHERTGRRGLSR